MSRVSNSEAFERLEPCEGKLSRTVLRGGNGSDVVLLLEQLLEQKQKFIGQIMTSKSPVRSADDVDEAALSFAEVKALASGNPLIREKMELDNDVARLKMIQASYQSQICQMQDDISINYPTQIAELKAVIAALEQDQKTAEAIPVLTDKDGNEQIDITVVGKQFRDKKEAGLAIIAACAGLKEIKTGGDIGTYGGFTLSVTYDSCWNKFDLHIKGKASRKVEIGKDPNSNIRKIKAELALIPQYLENARLKLETVEQQLENAKIEVTKPFPQEAELNEKLERLSALNRELDNGVEVKASQVKTSDVIAGDDCDYVRKPSILGRLRKAQAAKRSQQPRVPQNQKKRDHSI